MGKKQTKTKSKNKSNKVTVKYSGHALERMEDRIISRDEVERAVRLGTYYVVDSREFRVVYNNVRIIVNEDKKNRYTVITVLHSKEFEAKLEFISKKENKSLRSVAKRLKNIKSTRELFVTKA